MEKLKRGCSTPPLLSIDNGGSRAGTGLILAVVLVLLAFTLILMAQNVDLKRRLDENTLAVENLSTQLESMTMENSELSSQKQYLEDAIRDYQERVRTYQAEVQQLRQLANLTTDNSTLLAGDLTIRMVVPAVMAETSVNIWGRREITGYTGIATNLTLEAVFGQGRVLVDTKPPMGEVFQDTAVMAKETAEKITGKKIYDHDLIFSIEAPEVVPSVDGPSAGAAMALMVLALLEERSLDPVVSLTGTVSPDGGIGAIGGVVEKAIAAEEAGTRIFCIPRENEYIRVPYVREIPVGPITWRITDTREVETKSFIQDQTDLNVVLVDDVQGLFEIATYKEG